MFWGGLFAGDVAGAVCAEQDEEEGCGDEGFGGEGASSGGAVGQAQDGSEGEGAGPFKKSER